MIVTKILMLNYGVFLFLSSSDLHNCSNPFSTVFEQSVKILAVTNSNGAPPKEYRRHSHVCAIFHLSDSDGGIFDNVAVGHYQQSPPGEECFIFLRIGSTGQLGSLKQHWCRGGRWTSLDASFARCFAIF